MWPPYWPPTDTPRSVNVRTPLIVYPLAMATRYRWLEHALWLSNRWLPNPFWRSMPFLSLRFVSLYSIHRCNSEYPRNLAVYHFHLQEYKINSIESGLEFWQNWWENKIANRRKGWNGRTAHKYWTVSNRCNGQYNENYFETHFLKLWRRLSSTFKCLADWALIDTAHCIYNDNQNRTTRNKSMISVCYLITCMKYGMLASCHRLHNETNKFTAHFLSNSFPHW